VFAKESKMDETNLFYDKQFLLNPDEIIHDSNKECEEVMFAGTSNEPERDIQVGNNAEGSTKGNHWKSWKFILESMLPLSHGNENRDDHGIKNDISSGGVRDCIREALSLPRADNNSQVPLKFLPHYIEARELSRAENTIFGHIWIVLNNPR
jgi:hypothetical protein